MATPRRKVAVVTGAGGGIGAAVCAELAQAGMTIFGIDRSATALDGLLSRLGASGLSSHCVCGDLTSEEFLEDARKTLLKAYGPADVLVNAAGYLAPAASIDRFDMREWDRSFAINLRSVLIAIRSFGGDMKESHCGSIVNVASSAATLPNASAPYGCSKAALVSLTRQIAMEWGPFGVRCNAVSPGFLVTQLSSHLYQNPEIYQQRSEAVALRRIGSVDDVARVVAFLAGDGASYISGQDIAVDGGLSVTSLMRLQPEGSAYRQGDTWP